MALSLVQHIPRPNYGSDSDPTHTRPNYGSDSGPTHTKTKLWLCRWSNTYKDQIMALSLVQHIPRPNYGSVFG